MLEDKSIQGTAHCLRSIDLIVYSHIGIQTQTRQLKGVLPLHHPVGPVYGVFIDLITAE